MGGGAQPRWRRDGRELYFLAPDRRLIAVPIEAAAGTLRLGKPQPLLQTAMILEGGIGTRADYDVTRDGKRFIIAESPDVGARADTPLTILVNWKSAVAKGVRPSGAADEK